MKRFAFLAVFTFFVATNVGWTQDAKSTDKKPETKEELILGKTIGEWITILRTHDNPKFRRAALIALEASNSAGRIGLAPIMEAIEKDKEPRVRLEAVLLLGRLPKDTRGAGRLLVTTLQNDKSEAVRESAATAIANTYSKQAEEYTSALVEALKDPHPGTRMAVAGAFRNMGEYAAPAFPAMLEAVKNPKELPEVRVSGVHLLSRHDKENAKLPPVLLKIVADADDPVPLREAAIDGLARLGADTPEVVAALCVTLGHKSLELRKSSAIALGSFGAKAKPGWATIKDRINLKNETDGSVRNHLIRLTGTLAKENPEAIVALIDIAKADSTENRIAAIQELAELGARAKDALPELTKLESQDARAAIRDAAGKAITQIRGK